MEEKQNKSNEYVPSKAELKILEVALNPDFMYKSILEKCEVAGVSNFTWYKAMKNERFIELLNKMSLDLVKSKVADVINATYNFAISNSKCSTDRKMLLTMAGMYVDKQETENKNTNDNTVRIKLEGDLKEWAK